MTAIVIIKGPVGARVFIDGGYTGETNTQLMVETGTHYFGLTADVTASSTKKVMVEDRGLLGPMEIDLS